MIAPSKPQPELSSAADYLTSPTLKPELKAVTGLRFIAAFDVVLYHFAHISMPSWAAPIKNIIGSGYIAVNLFYLLSGFILAYSYIGKNSQLRGTKRRFYVSRFARIYPAYLLAFFLAAPTDIMLSLRINHPATAAVKLSVSAILLLTMQQAWTPWTAWVWNYPAWSVSVEAFFYLVFPWLGPMLSRIRVSRFLMVATALWVLSLFPPAMLFLTRGTTGAPQLGDHLQIAIECTPLLRLPEFAIGILLGRAYTLGYFAQLRGKYLSLVAGLALVIVLAFFPQIPHPLLANGLLTPLFCLLIVTLAHGNGPLGWFLSFPLMVFLGEVSYGIYILQVPVAFVLRKPPPLTSVPVLALFCVVLTVTAIVSFRFIEVPLRGRIKSWLA